MKQRLNLITLGDEDLPGARRFYEALGWHSDSEPDSDAFWTQPGAQAARSETLSVG